MINKEYFVFTEKKILIYAAGGVGLTAYDNLKSLGIDIEGFVDKRASLIKTTMGKPVITWEELKAIEFKDEYVVFITLRNVFEHVILANQLLNIGFFNLIYKPIAILRGHNENKRLLTINDAHDDVLIRKAIPCQWIARTSSVNLLCYEDGAFISRNHGTVKAYLPSELLFTNYSENPKWSIVNFISSYAAVDLYDALENNKYNDYDNIIDYYIDNLALYGAKTGGLNTEGDWRKIVCESRIAVFEEMKKTKALNYNFFIENCTKAQFDGKLKFELTASGKNRVSFLISQSYRYIPIELSEEDYKRYLNIEKVNSVIEYLSRKGNPTIFAPIPHPYFYHYGCGYVADNYMDVWNRKTAQFLSSYLYKEYELFNYDKLTIADGLLDDGCTSRFFAMLGCKVTRFLNGRGEFEEKLDDLFGYDKSQFHQNIQDNFTVGFVDGDYELNELNEMLNHIDKFCFAYTSSEDRLVKYFATKGFTPIQYMFKCIWGGKKMSGIIFEK